MEKIQEYMKKSNILENFDDSDEIEIFEKKKYEEFYDLVNNVILFFVLNTYETLIKEKDDFNLEKINLTISNKEKLLNTLKLQLNIYWTDFNKKKNHNDQLILDLNDLIKIDILKHKLCLFKYIKNMCIFIIEKISQINLENLNNHNDFKEKIAVISNSILQINKITGLEDEDNFECDGCEYNTTYPDKEIFWI
jgi:hypothetical protein